MQYMGGKARIAKRIASVLIPELRGRHFIEPFCGALNVTAQMAPHCEVFASDAAEYLITFHKAMQSGWRPHEITREEYAALKKANDPKNPMTAFAAHGVSFGGKFFGGYANRERPEGRNPNRDYIRSAAAAAAKADACKRVRFSHASYNQLFTRGALVYCDPPYANTEGYSVCAFDSAAFWQTVRRWSAQQNTTVFISEYTAPEDFECVWQHTAHVSLSSVQHHKIEKLFRWKG